MIRLESVTDTGLDYMTIAEDTWLELVLTQDEPVLAQVALKTQTKLNTTIGTAIFLNGNSRVVILLCEFLLTIESQGVSKGRIDLKAISNVDEVLNVQTSLEVRHMILLRMIQTLQLPTPVSAKVVLTEDAKGRTCGALVAPIAEPELGDFNATLTPSAKSPFS